MYYNAMVSDSHAIVIARTVSSIAVSIVRGLPGEKVLRGKHGGIMDTDGPSWQPKGVGMGGRCVPFHPERRKLKYNMVSMLSMSHLIDTSGFRTNTCSGSMEYN